MMMRAVPVGELEGVIEALREIEGAMRPKMVQVSRFVGIRTIEYLRSFTDKMAPPVRRGDPPRRRHPGYWADRSGQLAAGYAWDVEVLANGVALILSNSAGHAAVLERREGYFVLSGVADPGGPVEAALRRAVAELAPDWEVRTYD